MKRSWLALVLGILAGVTNPAQSQQGPPPGAMPGGEGPPPGPPIPADMMQPPRRLAPNVWDEPQITPEPPTVIIGLEYLRYWVRQDDSSQFFITSTNNPVVSQGQLGNPATTVLYGGEGPQKALNGARATVVWAPGSAFPVEVIGFWTEENGSRTYASNPATGNPPFARPIFATQLPGEVAFLGGFPGGLFGGVGYDFESQLYSGEFNVHSSAPGTSFGSASLFLGGRYLALKERLQLMNTLTPGLAGNTVNFGGASFGVGNTTTANDDFRTENEFYGAQIGVRCSLPLGPCLLDLRSKVSGGWTEQTVQVNGSSTLVTNGAVAQVLPGGIQAVPSNIGRRTDNKFTVVPEFNASIQIPVAEWFHISVGYDFLYWFDVVRPGSQFSRFVDTRQVPTDVGFDPANATATPGPLFQRSDFWAHGLNAGFAFIY